LGKKKVKKEESVEVRTMEIARECNVSDTTVRKWIKRDKLLKASVDVVGYYISPEDWKEFKEKHLEIVTAARLVSKM
jgi:uncharacterized protein YjcR